MLIQKFHNHLSAFSVTNWIHHLSRDYGGEPDYSLRLPRKFRALAIIGLLGLSIAIVLWQFFDAPILSFTMMGIALLHAAPALIGAIVLWSTRGLRLHLRNRMVESVSWHGNEHVLDVGTGSGITLIGCAQRLTTGKAVGIDHWDPNAGGGNADIFWKNVQLAGVDAQTELHNLDIRQTTFEDSAFDVIMSSFAVHHFGNAADRRQAASEMVRMLKVGGRIVICDFGGVLSNIEEEMQIQGFVNVKRDGWGIQILIGEKRKQL